MSAFRLHTPTAISPSVQGNAWDSVASDQRSNTSGISVGTIQRPSNFQLSPGSAHSLGSTSSARLRAGNENLVAGRNALRSSLSFSPYQTNSSPMIRTSKQDLHRSSWGNDIPLLTHKQRVSSLLAEAGPMEDIDLNAGCGESLYSMHESARDADDKADRGLLFDTTKQEKLSTSRLPNNTSREETGPRSFNIATEHPLKSENPLKRLIHTLRPQGPKRRHSLTVRKERWTLDDFDEVEAIGMGLPQSKRLKRHQKASSCSSSGIRNAIKSATVRLQSKIDRPRSPIFSRSHILRSNKGSTITNTASRASIDNDQAAAIAEGKAAWDRAVKRRRILEELISSEESYVADLKVLLHVRGPYDSTLGSGIADRICLGLLLHAQLRTKGPSSYTARNFAECCRHAALA